MSDSRYFVLKDDLEHTTDPEGNLKPINDFGLSVATPTVSSIGLTETVHTLSIQPQPRLTDEVRARVIPNTRYVETDDVIIAIGILDTGLFIEVDEPKKADVDKARKETDAHIDALKKRDQAVAAGDIPAPDVNDAPNPAADGQED